MADLFAVAGAGVVTAPPRTPPPGPPPEHFPAPWASDWGEDPWGFWQAFAYRGVRQGFRWIPPTPEPFLMGSPQGEHDRFHDERQHDVMLTRGYWLAETACTQALWQAVMGENPSRFRGERRPVETVCWEDAQRFCERLNAEAVGPKHDLQPDLEPARFRLPTEAEWEYACRAGTTTPFSFGEDITPEQANYDGNYPYRGGKTGLFRGETVEVASLPANPWGLYEMHGNIWEWCRDYDGYPASPETGGERVLRGGGWIDGARRLRSAFRYGSAPGDRDDDFGFRLALGPEPGQARQAGQERGRTDRARSER